MEGGKPILPEPPHRTAPLTRRAEWQKVHTDSGWHLRLVGANHEIVLVSEVYEDPDSADEALAIAANSLHDEYRSVADFKNFATEVDQRD